jgi:hypothetical protein
MKHSRYYASIMIIVVTECTFLLYLLPFTTTSSILEKLCNYLEIGPLLLLIVSYIGVISKITMMPLIKGKFRTNKTVRNSCTAIIVTLSFILIIIGCFSIVILLCYCLISGLKGKNDINK